MKLEALDHPKTLDFASRLNIELPTAIGYLELLWAFTGKKSPQGNIGKWPDGAIARACYFMGDPQSFLQSLLQSGFIDPNPEHRYVIHDWEEHCPRWVSAKLKKLELTFLGSSPSVEPTAVATAVATTVPSSHARAFPRQGKGREGKTLDPPNGHALNGASTKVLPPAEPPPGLDAAAWSAWIEYRKGIRKPIKSASVLAAQRQLAGFGADQVAVVEQSIAAGWQGLFALKDSPGKPKGGGDNGLPFAN